MTSIARISRFLREGMWEATLKNLPDGQALPLRCLRVLILALQGFIKNNCQRTASVLTYFSILNAVPLVAVAFAIAKGFGLDQMVENQIIVMAEKAQWQSDITNQILTFARSLLEQAKGGLIAGMGVILLFWTVITILGKIEDSFNEIWGTRKPRTLVRKLTDYIAIMAFAPVLLAISGSVTIVVASRLKDVIREYSSLGEISTVIFFVAALLPYVFIWVLLTMLYIVMPNTKVPIRSAVVWGVVAGTLYQLVQWVYIKFQIGVASYGAIYGSFAALPLFLGWLQMSWMIVLFGSELASAGRHYETFGFQPDYTRISTATKKELMLRIYHLLVRKFSLGEAPLSTDEISNTLEIPIRLAEAILLDLINTGLVVEVIKEGSNDIAFQPGKSIESVTIKDVFDAYEQSGKTPPARSYPEEDKIPACLKDISHAVEQSQGNMRVKDI